MPGRGDCLLIAGEYVLLSFPFHNFRTDLEGFAKDSYKSLLITQAGDGGKRVGLKRTKKNNILSLVRTGDHHLVSNGTLLCLSKIKVPFLASVFPGEKKCQSQQLSSAWLHSQKKSPAFLGISWNPFSRCPSLNFRFFGLDNWKSSWIFKENWCSPSRLFYKLGIFSCKIGVSISFDIVKLTFRVRLYQNMLALNPTQTTNWTWSLLNWQVIAGHWNFSAFWCSSAAWPNPKLLA